MFNFNFFVSLVNEFSKDKEFKDEYKVSVKLRK